jgi:hypothetical protein
MVNDHPVQGTQIRIDGYKIPFGMRFRPAGKMNRRTDINSLSCMRYFRCPVPRTPRVSNRANQVIHAFGTAQTSQYLKDSRHRNRVAAARELSPADYLSLPVSAGFGAGD